MGVENILLRAPNFPPLSNKYLGKCHEALESFLLSFSFSGNMIDNHQGYIDLVSTTTTEGFIAWSEYAAPDDCDGKGDSNETEDCSENESSLR